VSRRRRGIVLAGLALLLGGLAASDVAGREAALRERLGPLVAVVVAQRPVDAGARLQGSDLGVRRVPQRFAPAGVFDRPEQLIGQRIGAPLSAGTDITAAALKAPDPPQPGAPVRRGERVADVVAVGSPGAIVAGTRVDVLVTRDAGDGTPGRTELALEDVEVLAARAADAGPGERGDPHVAASLRVTLRQAVYLAAAQSFATELRLLPRAAGDRRHRRAPLAVGDSL
jgi:pilus assembly protein CpaB